MKSFFKSFFASLLALFIFFGLVFLLFFGIAGSMLSDKVITLEKNAVLVIDLSNEFKERKMEDPFAELSGKENTPTLATAIKLIDKAKADSMIKGIYLVAKDNPNGFATSQELINALQSFKASKKFVIAYGDYISQKAYAVAQVSDKIYCNPKGIFQWQGFSAEYVFFKSLIDKLEIKPQIFYAGKFKSATEPFRATEMSAPNKEQTSVWLNDIYGEMISQVSKSRKIDKDTLRSLANRYAIDIPESAVKAGLIDGVKYDDEVKDEIKKRLGLSKSDKIGFISLAKYKDAVSLSGAFSKDKIALVVAEGEIVYGKGSPSQIGSEEYLALLRKLRYDKSVKAIVLRVNSPGGSSLASEIIWRELEMIKKQGIPIVVSMGDVAASGGYYIAANSNKIFVQPNTITGSIGVFSIIPDFSSFMKNKLGVTFDRVKTSEFADAPSVTRPLSEREQQIVQHEIDRIYLDFKTRVADGRKKSLDYIDSIAQGRVWTGSRAIQIGLADAIGGQDQAIAEAAKLAGLKEYKVRTYPEEKTLIEYILQQVPDELSSSSIEKEIGKDEYMIFKRIKALKEESGQAKSRLPFDFIIR